jgi:DnaJ-class molecular chaperone
MTGCTKQIKCLDGTNMPLNLRPGIQHGAEFASNGRGFRNINSGRPGALIIIVSIDIPAITDPNIIKKLEEIYAEINHTS